MPKRLTFKHLEKHSKLTIRPSVRPCACLSVCPFEIVCKARRPKYPRGSYWIPRGRLQHLWKAIPESEDEVEHKEVLTQSLSRKEGIFLYSIYLIVWKDCKRPMVAFGALNSQSKRRQNSSDNETPTFIMYLIPWKDLGVFEGFRIFLNLGKPSFKK